MRNVLYCTCAGTLSAALPAEAFAAGLGKGFTLTPCERLCSAEGCRMAAEAVKGGEAVVAACSLGARGAQALAGIRKSGIRAELADIREGCAWTGGTPEELAERAAASVRVAVARLDAAGAAPARTVPARSDVLVIGAGPAGIAAASTLARLGVDVTLAEKRPEAGGMILGKGRLFPDMAAPEERLAAYPLDGVKLLAGCEAAAMRRFGGGYSVTLRKGDSTEAKTFGAVILAAGAKAAPACAGRSCTSSQMELDDLLSAVEAGRAEASALPARAVFLLCAGDSPCSGFCCPEAVKNALRLRSLGSEVTVVSGRMSMPGIRLEELMREAMRRGVRFIHTADMAAVAVERSGSAWTVGVPDAPSAPGESIEVDAVIAPADLVPAPELAALASGTGLALDARGFAAGHEPAHPLESSLEGVFLCGSVRWPASSAQAAEQGTAAAMLAVRWIREGHMPADEIPEENPAARIRTALCSGCGRCSAACPHGACRPGPGGKAAVEPALCRRCGACAAACPCHAAVLPGGLDSAQITAALGSSPLRQRRLG